MKTEIDERIKEHYLLEKSLAQRILESGPEERTQVTIKAYDELFSTITWHPQLHYTTQREQRKVAQKWMFFGHLVGPDSDILDIGAGTAYWTRYLAEKSEGRCVGIDVSKEVLKKQPQDPANLELYVRDAVTLEFPADSFDIAFSSQLIEHLHPDDVQPHLANVYKVLKPNGVYAFDTPSRLNGPHDISKHFDDVATGFHLKEWTYTELAEMLKKTGFRKVRTMFIPWDLAKHSALIRSLGTVSVSLITPAEKLVEKIAVKRIRTALCKLFRVTPVYITAQK